MSERLPFGWSIKMLGDLAQVVSGATPSRDAPQFWDGTIPWITPTDITATEGKYISGSKEKITKLGLLSCSASLLPAGAILMTSRATLGEAKISTMPACTNQGFKSLVTKSGVSNEFLYYQLQRTKQDYARYGSGSTFLEVGKKDTVGFPILIPDEASQTKIAEVLSLLDVQIEASEALLAKQEQVRSGFIQDLFARGVDEDGQLRPRREDAPDHYHQTELGWLPKAWEVGPLSRWVSRVTYGFTNPMPTALEGPYMVTAADVGDGEICLDTCRRTTDRAFVDLLTSKSKPTLGDILLTKDGTLGRLAQVNTENICVNQSVAVITPLDISDSTYLFSILRTPQYQARLIADAGGSTIKHIYISTVERMLCAKPKEAEERDAIVAICTAAEQWLLKERQNLAKARLLKSGLMQDLLSGKVSVSPLLESAAA